MFFYLLPQEMDDRLLGCRQVERVDRLADDPKPDRNYKEKCLQLI